jgi:hypothetical protein
LCQASGIPATPETTEPSLIWEGGSGGLRIQWTTLDVAAQKGEPSGAPAFSIVSRLRASFEQDETRRLDDDARVASEAKARGEKPPTPNPCVQETRIAVLSVVGTLLSVRETTATSCQREAHPSGEARFVSLDLGGLAATGAKNRGPATAKLTDYFPTSAVFEALRKDPIVREALQANNVRPKSLAQLIDALASSAPVLDEKRCYAFTGDLLSRFAFHHLENSRVAVRLSLAGAGPCRENLTQIGLLLPVPQRLGHALAAAAARAEGFLMRDAESIARGRQTVANFRSQP